MGIEFLYYCEAEELSGSEFARAGSQEVELDCYCDYDWSTDCGAEAVLCSALINGGDRDVIDNIGTDLRLAIEERALEVVIERAEKKEAIREDVLRGRRYESA